MTGRAGSTTYGGASYVWQLERQAMKKAARAARRLGLEPREIFG